MISSLKGNRFRENNESICEGVFIRHEPDIEIINTVESFVASIEIRIVVESLNG